MQRLRIILLCFLSVLCLPACVRRKDSSGESAARALKGRAFKVFLILDFTGPKVDELKSGLVGELDAILAESGASASYETIETRLDEGAAEAIKGRILREKPDLVFCVNDPSGFADSRIAVPLKGTPFRFVSENVVPVQSGAIASWEKPGGNIAGVGIFVQLNSSLRLLRKVAPGARRIYSYSWDRMTVVDAWWKAELGKACQEEGFEFAQYSMIGSMQAELAWIDEHGRMKGDAALMPCTSSYVNEDGSPIDVVRETANFAARLQTRVNVPFIAYEDSVVRMGALMGVCVIWRDLGAQLADLGERVLSGEDPGSIPWQYPRKFNVVINKKTADRLGIAIPQEIIDAAYRIYTDYDGSYMGH